jgi:hypothetical protein
MRSRRPGGLLVLAGVVLAVAAAGTVYAVASPGAAVPRPVLRLDLAATNNPTGGRGRTLALTKVVIPAGAEIALHHHPAPRSPMSPPGT